MGLKIAVGFFVFCILLITVFRSQFKGDLGEISIALQLKNLDKTKYIKLHDIKLKNPTSNTKTVQLDHIVLSTYGIFCIETKAYKGKIYGSDYSSQWTQYLANQQHKFMNPLFQNYGHMKAVEAILQAYYPNMAYYSIIAFSGEADLKSLDIKNAAICKISRIAEVIKLLSTNEVISEEELKNVEKIINSNKSYQSNFSHVRDIKKIKKENEKKISQNICPKCGGQLVERNGKYGPFIGCSNFPKCRFVVDNK